MAQEYREESHVPCNPPNMRNCITFHDVLYTSIIGRQTTSHWDAANVTLVEVLAMSPGDVMRSHWGLGVYPIANSAGGMMIHLCTGLWGIHGDQKLGMITFRRQLQTSETVEYTLLKFHDKKDYLRFLKTLSEIRTYYYTTFSV